ncbi:MAG: nucleotidyltransferase family protein [Pseudolabrys sp.]
MSPSSTIPHSAMVLAAGYGTRMRPLTDDRPKPMVPVAGRPLIDHVLDRLADAGVAEAVVNVHYLADVLEQHLKERQAQGAKPAITISDERNDVLGTGGGVVKALPLLGDAPFLHLNSDTIWIDGTRPNLDRLIEAFDPATMDALLLLAPVSTSIGYDGRGDYTMGADGRLTYRQEGKVVPFVFAGAAMLSPALFRDAPQGEFALTVLFDRAIEAGRLFGLRLDGVWMHVGTPEAISAAEAAIAASTQT